MTVGLYVAFGGSCATTEELRTCGQDRMWPRSLKYLLCVALDRKFAEP